MNLMKKRPATPLPLHCVCSGRIFWHYIPMKSFFRLAFLAVAVAGFIFGKEVSAQTTSTNLPEWMTRPIPLLDALNLALQQNAAILKAKNDLDATYGIVVQTRAVALPQLTASGQYKYTQPSDIE